MLGSATAHSAFRNECLDQWVDNPEMVEQQKLWPRHWSWQKELGPKLCFAGCGRCWEATMWTCQSEESASAPRTVLLQS